MSDALSPMDRSSLVGEAGPVNMTIGSLVFIERGSGVDYDAICQRFRERIHLVPRCRQRLDEGRTGLSNAVWVDDENFDVEWHIRSSALPAPGGRAELLRQVGNEMSRRLDRSRPLWELHLIEGSADGRLGLLIKMHHALVDGSSALGIGMVVLDLGPEAEAVEPVPTTEEERPGLLARQARRFTLKPLSKAQALVVEGTSRVLETSPITAAADLREAGQVLRDCSEVASLRSQHRSTTRSAPTDHTNAPRRLWICSRRSARRPDTRSTTYC